MKRLLSSLVLSICVSVLAKETVWLDSMDLSAVQQGWGEPQCNKTVDGNPIVINGVIFKHGLGTHANSFLTIRLNGKGLRFTANVGIPDEVSKGRGSVVFKVSGDGKVLYRSPVIKAGQPARRVAVDLSGIAVLALTVSSADDGINYDHAVWADAKIEMTEGKPIIEKNILQQPQMGILTPAVGPEPKINGARIVGVRPGHPFLFTIPATGTRPMCFSATGLPDELTLDAQTGIISGIMSDRAEGTDTNRVYRIVLTAENAHGIDHREFKIVVGDTIALTPPMGWNSWNCFAHAVTAEDIRNAAKAMVERGLINHGWAYINIDDYWEVKPGSKDPSLLGPERDEDGYILPNKRFPDMKGLIDEIHAMGLKVGIYSSPGPKTCGGCIGSYQHEEQDAQRYADWGVDYLKYDWCSYGKVATGEGLERLKKPYIVMRDALLKQKRDIVYSLCQYGMGKVWEWGAAVGGNCWRTTGDIRDTWDSVSRIGFKQAGLEKYAGPGHWNDPDMLVVGVVGWGKNMHKSRLTHNEQYSHISLWCLLAAPLLIGCDLTKLDDFTLNLLTNDEVLEVNQDPLGKQAARISKNDELEVWAKQMEDGSWAVGLFNRSIFTQVVSVNWSDIGIMGACRVRDLWRQKDLGFFKDKFESEVYPHGVTLVRIFPLKR